MIEAVFHDVFEAMVAIGAVVSSTAATVACFLSWRNGRKVEEVRAATNGMKKELEDVARREGAADAAAAAAIVVVEAARAAAEVVATAARQNNREASRA